MLLSSRYILRELNFHNSTYEQWTLLAQKLGCLADPRKIKKETVAFTNENYEKLKMFQLEEEYQMHRTLIMDSILPRMNEHPELLRDNPDLHKQLKYFAACCGGYVPLKSLNKDELATFAARASEPRLQEVLCLLGDTQQLQSEIGSPRSSVSSQMLMQSQVFGSTISQPNGEASSKEAFKKLVSRLMPF